MAGTLLITGGSGYLGGHLARQALLEWDVTATIFRHDAVLPRAHVVRLDLRDCQTVTTLVRALRPHAIIHTACDMSSPETMQSSIVAGTRNLACAAAETGAYLVHMSTDMVFDGENAPYSPDDPPKPITQYGSAKSEAERIVADVLPAAAIVRTSLIYGFAPPDPRTMWVIDSLRQRLPITLFTDEVRSPVWVEQLCVALLELAETRMPGIWHIAGPQPIDRYALGVALAKALGQDSGGLMAGLSRGSGLVRPRNLTLDVADTLRILKAPLWGVTHVLEALGPVH